MIHNIEDQKIKSKGSRPITFLSVIFVLTWVALIWFGWNAWSSYHKTKTEREYHSKMEKLHGTIIHLDEVLTMSARMAAATGDLQWEKRYRSFEPKLDAAIKEAMRFVPEAYSGKAAFETDAANIRLVEMENQSFDLIRQGRIEEAKALLFSDEYENQKRIYAQGMTKFAIHNNFYLRFEELRGIIIHLDEVLTMSARMAAATGDLQWEKRYRSFEPKLDAAIKEAMRLVPEAYSGKAASETDAANIRLVEMENQSFDLIRQGRIEEAKALLFSDEYENQKRIYAQGMTKFAVGLSAIAGTSLKDEQRHTFLHIGMAFLLIPLLIIVWFVALRIVSNWEATLISKEALEKEVAERKKAEEALRKRTSELKRALNNLQNTQSQLLQSEKMASIGQLAAGVAHEINNPVGFIKSNLNTINNYRKDLMELLEQYQILEESINNGNEPDKNRAIQSILENIPKLKDKIDLDFILEDFNQVIEESLEGTERVVKIVCDLKDFAHLDKAELEEFDINKGIESTLNIVQNEIKYKAEVIKDLGSIPLVKCYPQRINQVIMNLLVNAAQAIENKGEIRIATRSDDGAVDIKISDTGCGIPPDNLQKIFDPFFTTKDVGKGTGLGLNVAYNIIKKHNGTIEVESTVGKGTAFSIRLPIQSLVTGHL